MSFYLWLKCINFQWNIKIFCVCCLSFVLVQLLSTLLGPHLYAIKSSQNHICGAFIAHFKKIV